MESKPQVFRPLTAHLHAYVPHAIWPAQYKTCQICGKVVPTTVK